MLLSCTGNNGPLAEAKTPFALHDSVLIYRVTHRPIVKMDVHFFCLLLSQTL